MGRREQNGFNTPFADLKKSVKEKLRAQRDTEREAQAKGPTSGSQTLGGAHHAARMEAPPEAPIADDEPVDEDALFRSWVGGVTPIEEKERVAPAKRREVPPGTTVPDEDAEVLATLSDLVAGEGTFEICDTNEYVEGIAPGLDRRLLRRLKTGDFSVQAHLDLHGMFKNEARQAVEQFIRSSRHAARRCVIVVHGRGLRSPGGEPVLKKALVKWLSRGELGRQVLAFCTTLAHDGGGGAVYILLRR